MARSAKRKRVQTSEVSAAQSAVDDSPDEDEQEPSVTAAQESIENANLHENSLSEDGGNRLIQESFQEHPASEPVAQTSFKATNSSSQTQTPKGEDSGSPSEEAHASSKYTSDSPPPPPPSEENQTKALVGGPEMMSSLLEVDIKWSRDQDPTLYKLKFLDVAEDDLYLQNVKEHCQIIVQSIAAACKNMFKGQEITSHLEYYIFSLLGDRAISKLELASSARIAKTEANGRETSSTETKQMLAVLLYSLLSRSDLDRALRMYRGDVTQSQRDGSVLTDEQFKSLLQHFSAIDSDHSRTVGMKDKRTDMGLLWDGERDLDQFVRSLFDTVQDITSPSNQNVVITSGLVGEEQKFNSRPSPIRSACYDGQLPIMYAASLYGKKQARPEVSETLRDVCDRFMSNPKAPAKCLITQSTGDREEAIWAGVSTKDSFFSPTGTTTHSPFLSLTEKLRNIQEEELRQGIEQNGPGELAHQSLNERALKVGLSFDEDFIVHDNNRLANEAFSASAQVEVQPGVTKTLTAFAVRNSSEVDGSSSSISHFLEWDNCLNKQLTTETICMEKYDVSSGSLTDVLFSPSAHDDKYRQEAEAFISNNGTEALTYLQRTACWFVLRALTITCSNSILFSKHDMSVRKLLYKDGEETQPGDSISSLLDTDSTAIPADLFRLDDFDMSDSHNQLNKSPVTSTSGCTSDDALPSVLWNIDSTFDLNDTEVEVAQVALRASMLSWFPPQHVQTKAMQSKPLNERGLIRALKEQNWCSHVFRVGLLASKRDPFLAVSSDAISRVNHPQSSSESFIFASTSVHVETDLECIARAEAIAKNYGEYFAISVGDLRWWDVISVQDRARILHQAAVLDTDQILHVIGSKNLIIFASLIHVPQSTRDIYRNALLKFNGCFNWAYSSVNVDSAPPKAPEGLFHGTDERILASHLRLWRALRRQICESGILPPIKRFKSLAQCAFQGCSYGSRKHAEQNSSLLLNLEALNISPEQKVYLRGVSTLVTNVAMLHQIVRSCSDADFSFSFPYTSLEGFRAACDNRFSIVEFTYRLCDQIALFAKTNEDILPSEQTSNTSVEWAHETQRSSQKVHAPHAPRPPAQRKQKSAIDQNLSDAPNGASLTRPEAVRIVGRCKSKFASKRREFFDKNPGKSVRLCSSLSHRLVPIGLYNNGRPRQRPCAICCDSSKRTTLQCEICLVPLHGTFNSDVAKSEGTCADRWHHKDSLN